jgi:hypothetical protein
MAKVRIGIATAFELENELVGIGTDNPTNTLQALGNIQSSDAKAIGVSTLTTFDGFTDTKAFISGSAGAKSGSTSNEIIVEGTVNVSSGTTFTSGPENLTVTDNFTLPGITDDKPSLGTTRFNEDLGTLEFYTGSEWRAVNSYVDMGGNGRGVWGGGSTPTYLTVQDFVTISSLGDAQYFGDLTVARGFLRAVASSVRGVTGGGEGSPARTDTMEYFTIQSAGNAVDFGNLSAARGMLGSASSSTRGVWGGGEENNPTGNVNKIEYIEIATKGNTVDFADLTKTRKDLHSGLVNSPTRGIFAGGSTPDSLIDVITIAAKATATKFGDLSVARKGLAGCSNSTRGVFACGESHGSPGTVTDIDYITIATDGNAVEFGDALANRYIINGGVSNGTRGVWSGGATALNIIEYINFSTTGNSKDFGELSYGRRAASGCSDSHGGLGGF